MIDKSSDQKKLFSILQNSRGTTSGNNIDSLWCPFLFKSFSENRAGDERVKNKLPHRHVISLVPYHLDQQSVFNGLFRWRWGTPGRWGNPPVQIVSHFNVITFRCYTWGRLPSCKQALNHMVQQVVWKASKTRSLEYFISIVLPNNKLPFLIVLFEKGRPKLPK